MNNFKEKVKEIAIAHRLSCEYDYCPSFDECKDEFSDILLFKATKAEVENACNVWSGSRSDEIINQLDRLF